MQDLLWNITAQSESAQKKWEAVRVQYIKTERIWGIDRGLAADVRKVLNTNKSERHIRGGMATKRKKALLMNSKAK